jgi:hypothetical protein
MITEIRPKRYSRSGVSVCRGGARDCCPLPHTPILATTILPSLRSGHSGQILLDDSDQAWQHRRASVASLRRLIGFLPEP